MKTILYGVIVAAILGGAAYFLGPQFVPEADKCYMIWTGEDVGCAIDRLSSTIIVAAFIGWSIGLVLASRR